MNNVFRDLWLIVGALVGFASCLAPIEPRDGGLGGGAGGDVDAGDGTSGGHVTSSCGANPSLSAPRYAVVDLGHTSDINRLWKTADRVLSHDSDGRWILWDSVSSRQLAHGQAPQAFMALAGQTFAFDTGTNVELWSAATGQQLATVTVTGGKLGLSIDGTYLWSATSTGLHAWSTLGQPLLNRVGNYAVANVFAAPTELQVASGVLANQIEFVPLSVAAVTSSPAFSGSFHSWFDDGARFFSAVGTNVWVYAKDGTQQQFIALPTIERLTGQGARFWTFQGNTPGYPLRIYSVGNAAGPDLTKNLSTLTTVVGGGDRILAIAYGTPSLEVIELGTPITSSMQALPIPYLSTGALASNGAWAVANDLVVDSKTRTGPLATLGCGRAASIVGADDGLVVLGTSSSTLALDVAPSGMATERWSRTVPSSHVELSADGLTLVASGHLGWAQYWEDRALRVYETSGGTEQLVFPYAWSDPTVFFDFAFARSAARISHLSGAYEGSTWTYEVKVTSASAPTSLLTVSTSAAEVLKLSPNGTNGALASGGQSENTTTQLYRNLTLSGAVQGFALGWIDDDSLLVNTYERGRFGSTQYLGAKIYDANGVLKGSPSLPVLTTFSGAGSSRIYAPLLNTIFDTQSGAAVWTSSLGPAQRGTVAGNQVVSVIGSYVYAEPR